MKLPEWENVFFGTNSVVFKKYQQILIFSGRNFSPIFNENHDSIAECEYGQIPEAMRYSTLL